MDVYSGGFPFCHDGLYQVQRHDGGAIRLGVDKIRVSDAKEDFVFPRQSLLRSVETQHRSEGKGLARPDQKAEAAGRKAREKESKEIKKA